MSTLKVAAINNPSASSGGLAFSTSGNVTGGGLDLVVPSSIAYSGGSASVSGGAVTFSGVSSVSLNGCFSSTYENYILEMPLWASTGAFFNYRMRLASTDNTAASYCRQELYATGTSVGGSSVTSQTSSSFAYSNNENIVVSTRLYGPALSSATMHTSIVHRGAATPIATMMTGAHNVGTSYDGITIYPSAGNMSGTIRIYGYRN